MNRIAKFTIIGSLVLILILRLSIILLNSPAFLVTTISDDSFYYLNVAQNIANGFGSTFDQINLTNGYHPLWMAIAVLFAKVIPGKELLLRVSLLAQFGLWMAGLWLIYKSFKHGKHKVYSLAGLVAILALFYPRYVSVLLSGLESALTFFLIIVFLRTFRTIRLDTQLQPIKMLAMSFLLGLIFLSRLDSIFVVVAVVCYLGFIILFRGNSPLPARIKTLLALGFPLGMMALSYLGWNIAKFGHAVPISGSLKTTFPVANLHLGYFLSFPEWLAVPFLIIGAYAVIIRSNGKAMQNALPMLVFGIGLLGHLLYTILFMNWAVFSWHFVMVLPGLAFMLGDIMSWSSDWWVSKKPFFIRNPRSRVLIPLTSITISVILLAGQYFALTTPEIWHQTSYQTAIVIRDSFPTDAVLAMKDSGVFGYYSERSVINLDGVINSFEYQDFLNRGEINDYLCSHNVSYVVQHRLGSASSPDASAPDYNQFSLELPSRLHGGISQLDFYPAQEVYRNEYSPNTFSTDAGGTTAGKELFVIWEIQPCSG